MFSNMTTSMFEGSVRLNSTGRTIAMSIVDDALPETIDLQPYTAGTTSELVNPVIVGAKMISNYFCRSRSCGKEFVPDMNSMPKCPHCNFRVVLSNLRQRKTLSITIDINDSDLDLTMINHEIEQCLIIKNLSTDDCETAILMLTNFKLTYNIRKNTILSLQHINPQQDQQQPDDSEGIDMNEDMQPQA